MSKKQRQSPCTVRDGSFVEMCTALEESVAGYGTDKRKGIVFWSYMNVNTGEATRSFVGVRSGDHAVKGAAFNFCPFCGTKIDAPFNPDADEMARRLAQTPTQ